MSNIGEQLPMPPDNPYANVRPNYFTYVWDMRGEPPERDVIDPDGREWHVITPTAGMRLVIYGRLCEGKYAEDRADDERLREQGRILGEWFSPLCPQGELGTVDLSICKPISAEEFSAAFVRGWTEPEPEPEPGPFTIGAVLKHKQERNRNDQSE